MFCAAELIVKTEFTYSCWSWAKLSEAESFHIWQLLSWSWSGMVIFPPWLNQEDCSKKRDQWEEEPESVMSLSYLQSKSGAATVSVQHHNSVSETWSKKCSWFGYFTDIITDYLDNTQHESAEQTNKHSQIKSTALKARCMLLMIFSERATCDHFLDRMNYCCSKPEWKLQIDNFMCS